MDVATVQVVAPANDKQYDRSNMKRGMIAAIGIVVALGLVVVAWLLVRQAHFDVLSPSGEIAVQQRNLLIFTLWLSALVVIPVYSMLGIFAWRYHEKNKKAKYLPEWSENKWLEALWWGIPVAIIGVLAVVTWQTSHALDPYRKLASEQETINVQVVALQWKWLFIYPDHGIATLNQLPVAEKAPIHFRLTADAPMSGFWVPALGSQIYAMNGMDSQLNLSADRTGDFGGYSTNINGRGYADMKFMVHSMTKQDFEAWIDRAKRSTDRMNMDVYDTLAEPSAVTKEKTYVLEDKRLYDKILERFMHGGMGHTYGAAQ